MALRKLTDQEVLELAAMQSRSDRAAISDLLRKLGREPGPADPALLEEGREAWAAFFSEIEVNDGGEGDA